MNQFHRLDLYHQNKGRRASVPDTPFLLLAKRIPPMYWRLFQGVTLDSRMGYTGRRQFHSLGKQSTGQNHQLVILGLISVFTSW